MGEAYCDMILEGGVLGGGVRIVCRGFLRREVINALIILLGLAMMVFVGRAEGRGSDDGRAGAYFTKLFWLYI